MSAREPTLPHETMFFRDWCDERGIDNYDYERLWMSDFRIARLHSLGPSVAARLRQEIEASLPLENCELVDDPRVKPDERWTTPKLYRAPDGMAFELKTQYEYEERDEWDDPIEGAPTKVRKLNFVGEYLDIATRVRGGQPRGDITVLEQPIYYAVPILNLGFDNPWNLSETDFIRLPSRFDAEKDGAYVSFARLDGWDIVCSGDDLGGAYGESTVSLVPFEKEEDSTLYVADFGSQNNFALDDFLFIDEKPELPPGFAHTPTRPRSRNWELTPQRVSQLILPPIEQDDWTDLWEDHGIWIKINPTIREPRFVHLDFSRPLNATRQVEKFNAGQKTGEMFLRLLAVRNTDGVSLKHVVKMVLSRDKLPAEEPEIEF